MILVTGATGLIGQHLIKELLNDNVPIKCLYNKTKPNLEHPSLQWVSGNISDVDTLVNLFENVDYVYHCAAMVSFDSKLTNSILDANVEGTKNIINLCLEKKIKKLIYISSVATLDKKILNKNIFLSETNILENPAQENIYAYSKFLAELEVWRGIEEGLCTNIVLPSIVLGSGNWNNSSIALFKQAYNEFPFYNSGTNGFVDVLDVVKACILLMKADLHSEKFILNGSNLSWKEITSLIAREFDKRKPFIYFPKMLVPFFSISAYLISLILGKKNKLSNELIQSTYKKISYSNQKFLSVFPEFSFTDIPTSVKRICQELKISTQLK